MITKGQKINDRYEVIRSIGEGGMANVYLGHDTILDRNVAIKVLRGDLSTDEKFVRRFQREALSASSLAHPNIVEMYDVGEDDGTYYIVMEYVEGKTLKQLLKKRGTLTLSEAIDIMSQLTDGMAHAHDSYIIHRDLKPQNIMIKDDGQIKITDFGIAMALNATQLTQTNSVMGSVHYLPPEQASGKGCTIKSDIYSMGIIFYELLTGTLPFRGDNAVEIALKHMRDPIPSVREENPNIPQSIENIIRKAAAKNPKNRYDSARSMHEDLLTALDESRMNEEVYQYKYPENENGEKKKKNTDTEKTSAKKKGSDVKKEKEEEIVNKEQEEAILEKDDNMSAELIEEEKETKKNKILIIVLSSIFAIIVLVFIILFFVLPGASSEKEVEVPDCTNYKVSTCTEKLQQAGFKVQSTIQSISSTEIDKNRVVKTEPNKGKTVKKGSKITIYKSSGEDTIKLENYVGKNAIEIKTKLEMKYELVVTIEKKEPEDSEKEYQDDEIIGQSLSEGSEVKKGDQLILYTPNIVDSFPDMVEEGWSLTDVEAFCAKYGLTLEKQEQETNAYAPGTIIGQSRTKGSSIVKGTTLRVTIAIKPKEKQASTPTPTPDSESQEEKEEKEENKEKTEE
ncbi:MAG: Stk1 family PASTA domain-containing Ser/Thr kinase [Bacilli bacterium]|nr:Stk1 family PASTA domain-containing Ser/Thr kinase [Bacilli bacterium]